MKKVFFLILLLYSSIISFSQGSIGLTEQQIRKEYQDLPNGNISVDYIDGEKNIIVVNQDATSAFCLNSNTGKCYRTMIQPRSKELLDNIINKCNKDYVVISRGSKWVVQGVFPIYIELRYSSKLGNTVLFYTNN